MRADVTSWWAGLSREQFYSRLSGESVRMAATKQLSAHGGDGYGESPDVYRRRAESRRELIEQWRDEHRATRAGVPA